MTNKNKKPARVRRQKLHVVSTPAQETKMRNFWQLFSNVRNPKWDAIMRKGNYLDDFVKIIEELSEENFNKLFDVNDMEQATRPARVKSAIRELKLEQYDEEVYYLLKLIRISQKAVHIPVNHEMKDFKSRITLGEGTKLLSEPVSNGGPSEGAFIKEAVTTGNFEVVDVLASTDDEFEKLLSDSKKVIDRFAPEELKPALLTELENDLTEMKLGDLAKEVKIKDLSVENTVITSDEMLKMQAETTPLFDDKSYERVSIPRPSLHSIFTSDANAERRKIHHGIYEMNDCGEYIPFIAEAMAEPTDIPSDEKIVAFSTAQKPQHVLDIEAAQTLLDRFDEEYAKRQCNVMILKKKMKEEIKGKSTQSVEFLEAYRPSFVHDTKAYLKAQREFDMIKKIWSQAREAFKGSKIEEVDTVALANEIQKLARFDLNHIFDDIYPSVEVYEKEMKRRSVDKLPVILFKDYDPKRGNRVSRQKKD